MHGSWADSDPGSHLRAAPIRLRDRILIGIVIFLGVQSVVLFALWWFRPEHVNQPVLFALLSVAVWYGVSRIVVGWYNYFHIEQPEPRPAPPGKRVAVFTTSSPGEPFEMFVQTLAALREVRYPHTTYLLDDTRDPRFRELAAQMGAVHLELVGLPGAKAGKVNAALEQTDEEFILVLDPDHVPYPPFLDRVLGYFDDPEVGFVQVAQVYYNQSRSFVARAAAEQTYAFYGPIMQGMHGSATAVAIGANCTFRRKALKSIGGHGIGLAEDLVTSIRLHAAGWRSIYVPEVLARGLVPEDLGSFLEQQLKWARGVYDVLFREYPRAFRSLSWHQRLSYLMIGTYYLVGVTTPIYLAVPLLYLLTGRQPAAMFLYEYLLHGLPVAAIGIAAYLFVQRWLCDPSRERGLHWRGTLLKIGSWSVYLKGLWLALRGIAVPYIPTAKERQSGSFLRHAALPLAIAFVSVAAAGWALHDRYFRMSEAEVRLTTEATAGMLAFAAVNVLFMSGRLVAAWESRRGAAPESDGPQFRGRRRTSTG
jgi:cellulose synthase (UDP-forming)